MTRRVSISPAGFLAGAELDALLGTSRSTRHRLRARASDGNPLPAPAARDPMTGLSYWAVADVDAWAERERAAIAARLVAEGTAAAEARRAADTERFRELRQRALPRKVAPPSPRGATAVSRKQRRPEKGSPAT